MKQKIILLALLLALIGRLLFIQGKKIPMRVRCDGGLGQ